MTKEKPEQLIFEPFQTESRPDVLDTTLKLRAISGDERAGFLPATHREKNQAVTLLDYIDNPAYPGGIHDHLVEIYKKHIAEASKQHHARASGQMRGGLAVRSVIYEFSDYATSAKNDGIYLSGFKSAIDDCVNPRLSLVELLADTKETQLQPAPFLRFLDIRAVMNGVFPASHDPLHTHEFRQRFSNGKNKIVQDDYTGENKQQYISERLESVHVGEARPLVNLALEDQRHRFIFWSKVLRSRYYEYQKYANDALELLK
jgi:hypothetical protein